MFFWSFKTVYFSSLLAVAFSRFKNSQSKSHSIHTLPDLPSTPWTVQKKIVLEDQKADSNFLALAELQSDKETEGWKTGQPESEKVTRESEREGDDGCHALTLTSRQPSVTTTDRSYCTHTHTHKHTHTQFNPFILSWRDKMCVRQTPGAKHSLRSVQKETSCTSGTSFYEPTLFTLHVLWIWFDFLD